MIDKLKLQIGKDIEGSGRGLIKGAIPEFSCKIRGKITKKDIRQDSRSPGRDLNQGFPEYESGVLTTAPRRSVRLDTVALPSEV
jgi:hypothetical protein